MKNVFCLLGCLLCLLFVQSVQAQSVENVVASFDGEKISITYDLNHTLADQKFKVSIFSSHNNFQSPITLVTGDVGDNILVGKSKKITWNVRSELPPYFNDDLSFKVKALLIALPKTEIKQPVAENTKKETGYKISPLQKSAFKRGRSMQLTWQGGSMSDQINVDLLKDDIVQQPLMPTQNTYSYQWQIPKKQSKGKNYAIRISSATNPLQKSTSDIFKIKSKTPFIVKVGIPIIIGALVGVLVLGKDNGGETPTNTNGLSELPEPITPGGG